MIELEASSGQEAFSRWLEIDKGSRYLGEFALIGEDSAIARSALFFDATILDENASSHVALGNAYTRAIVGGGSMTSPELQELGVNRSATHTDIMFGSTEVTIVATSSREAEVVLIDRGRWTERFL